MRIDGRENNRARKLKITPGYTKYAEGSVLIEMGETKVICTASVEEGVPPFLRGKGQGWVTAEYSMLPRATLTRNMRDISKLKLNGRAGEIQRLIGRSLRSVTDLQALGERSVTVDCDVIQADGGTRTASITGGFVALALAFKKLIEEGKLQVMPLTRYLAAISVGLVDGEPMLDLCYTEDSAAEVDMNVVMDSLGNYAELQATGEEATYTKKQFDAMLRLADGGIRALITAQKKLIGDLEADYPHYQPIKKLVIATNNNGKLKEMRELLAPLGVELLSISEAGATIAAEETGTTFEENAMIKAKAVSMATGLPAVADDSGLSVDFLSGAPGVYSSRFAGENATDAQRVELLLEKLEPCPQNGRGAHFTSSLALYCPDGRSFTVTGKCFGAITETPSGGNGFGYDPVFRPAGYDKTFGELHDEVKNKISHRAESMKKFYNKIKDLL